MCHSYDWEGYFKTFDITPFQGPPSAHFKEFMSPHFIPLYRLDRNVRYSNNRIHIDADFDSFRQRLPFTNPEQKYSIALPNLDAGYEQTAKFSVPNLGFIDPDEESAAIGLYLNRNAAIIAPDEGCDVTSYPEVIASLDLQSGSGFPDNRFYHNKRDTLADHTFFQRHLTYSDSLSKESPFPSLFCNSVKGEIRLTEKVLENQLRTFMAGSIHLLIAGATYFMAMNESMRKHHDQMAHSIGASHFYGGWGRLYDYLTFGGQTTEADKLIFITSDFSGFDRHLSQQIMGWVQIVRLFLLKRTITNDDVHRTRLKNIFSSKISAHVIMELGEVIRLTQGNPSGQDSTLSDNCIAHEIMWYMFCVRMKPGITIREILEVLRHKEMGDDFVAGLKSGRAPWFDLQKVTPFFNSIGMAFKGIHVHAQLLTTGTFDGPSYLSKQFVIKDGFVMARPERTKILDNLLMGVVANKTAPRKYRFCRLLALIKEAYPDTILYQSLCLYKQEQLHRHSAELMAHDDVFPWKGCLQEQDFTERMLFALHTGVNNVGDEPALTYTMIDAMAGVPYDELSHSDLSQREYSDVYRKHNQVKHSLRDELDVVPPTVFERNTTPDLRRFIEKTRRGDFDYLLHEESSSEYLWVPHCEYLFKHLCMRDDLSFSNRPTVWECTHPRPGIRINVGDDVVRIFANDIAASSSYNPYASLFMDNESDGNTVGVDSNVKGSDTSDLNQTNRFKENEMPPKGKSQKEKAERAAMRKAKKLAQKAKKGVNVVVVTGSQSVKPHSGEHKNGGSKPSKGKGKKNKKHAGSGSAHSGPRSGYAGNVNLSSQQNRARNRLSRVAVGNDSETFEYDGEWVGVKPQTGGSITTNQFNINGTATNLAINAAALGPAFVAEGKNWKYYRIESFWCQLIPTTGTGANTGECFQGADDDVCGPLLLTPTTDTISGLRNKKANMVYGATKPAPFIYRPSPEATEAKYFMYSAEPPYTATMSPTPTEILAYNSNARLCYQFSYQAMSNSAPLSTQFGDWEIRVRIKFMCRQQPVTYPNATAKEYTDAIMRQRYYTWLGNGGDCAGPDALLNPDFEYSAFMNLCAMRNAFERYGDCTPREKAAYDRLNKLFSTHVQKRTVMYEATHKRHKEDSKRVLPTTIPGNLAPQAVVIVDPTMAGGQFTGYPNVAQVASDGTLKTTAGGGGGGGAVWLTLPDGKTPVDTTTFTDIDGTVKYALSMNATGATLKSSQDNSAGNRRVLYRYADYDTNAKYAASDRILVQQQSSGVDLIRGTHTDVYQFDASSDGRGGAAVAAVGINTSGSGNVLVAQNGYSSVAASSSGAAVGVTSNLPCASDVTSGIIRPVAGFRDPRYTAYNVPGATGYAADATGVCRQIAGVNSDVDNNFNVPAAGAYSIKAASQGGTIQDIAKPVCYPYVYDGTNNAPSFPGVNTNMSARSGIPGTGLIFPSLTLDDAGNATKLPPLLASVSGGAKFSNDFGGAALNSVNQFYSAVRPTASIPAVGTYADGVQMNVGAQIQSYPDGSVRQYLNSERVVVMPRTSGINAVAPQSGAVVAANSLLDLYGASGTAALDANASQNDGTTTDSKSIIVARPSAAAPVTTLPNVVAGGTSPAVSNAVAGSSTTYDSTASYGGLGAVGAYFVRGARAEGLTTGGISVPDTGIALQAAASISGTQRVQNITLAGSTPVLVATASSNTTQLVGSTSSDSDDGYVKPKRSSSLPRKIKTVDVKKDAYMEDYIQRFVKGNIDFQIFLQLVSDRNFAMIRVCQKCGTKVTDFKHCDCATVFTREYFAVYPTKQSKNVISPSPVKSGDDKDVKSDAKSGAAATMRDIAANSRTEVQRQALYSTVTSDGKTLRGAEAVAYSREKFKNDTNEKPSVESGGIKSALAVAAVSSK